MEHNTSSRKSRTSHLLKNVPLFSLLKGLVTFLLRNGSLIKYYYTRTERLCRTTIITLSQKKQREKEACIYNNQQFHPLLPFLPTSLYPLLSDVTLNSLRGIPQQHLFSWIVLLLLAKVKAIYYLPILSHTKQEKCQSATKLQTIGVTVVAHI